MKHIDQLIAIGFKEVGFWFMENEQLHYNIKELSGKSNILYSFVIDGEIKYIGKSVRTLKERMSGYKTPGSSQRTNIKNNSYIISEISQSRIVKIYAFTDEFYLNWKGYKINLAAGLEDALISAIQPAWNKNPES